MFRKVQTWQSHCVLILKAALRNRSLGVSAVSRNILNTISRSSFLSLISVPHPSPQHVKYSLLWCLRATFLRLGDIRYSLSDIRRSYSHSSGRAGGYFGRPFNGSYYSLLPATPASLCIRVHDILYVRTLRAVLSHS